jgi:hypothetical protein
MRISCCCSATAVAAAGSVTAAASCRSTSGYIGAVKFCVLFDGGTAGAAAGGMLVEGDFFNAIATPDYWTDATLKQNT